MNLPDSCLPRLCRCGSWMNCVGLTLITGLAAWMPAMASAATTVLAPAALAHAALGTSDTDSAYKTITDKVGPTLVTIKFIMKVEASGQMAEYFGRYADEGVETEVTGVMIDPQGVVMVSNTSLGGYFAMMASRMGQGVNVNPTDLKILVGDDTEGVKAKMLARDKDLDLAWIQIDDPKAAGKTYPFVDFSQAATPAQGSRLYTIERKGKFFDHAMTIHEGRLGGSAKKPRSLLIPTGLQPALGMPVLEGEGKAVGVMVVQAPSKEDMEGGDMSELMSGGGLAMMIVPAADVLKATARSKAMGAEDAAKKAASVSEGASSTEPAKTESAKPGMENPAPTPK